MLELNISENDAWQSPQRSLLGGRGVSVSSLLCAVATVLIIAMASPLTIGDDFIISLSLTPPTTHVPPSI